VPLWAPVALMSLELLSPRTVILFPRSGNRSC